MSCLQIPVLSRELSSLREELASAQRQRPIQSTDSLAEAAVSTGTGAGAGVIGDSAASARRPEESSDEQELHSQLRDLVKEITDFVNDAENNISAHPAMSVVAAMLLGIVIGSLLARR